MMRRPIQTVLLAVAFALLSFASAATSLSTGAVLPGWDQIRSGGVHDTARSLLQDYARQVGISCYMVDVHRKDNATLITRSIHVDTWFDVSYDLRDLLTARDHHVILLEPRRGYGSDHLLLVIQLDRTLLLAAC